MNRFELRKMKAVHAVHGLGPVGARGGQDVRDVALADAVGVSARRVARVHLLLRLRRVRVRQQRRRLVRAGGRPVRTPNF